jgi:hypothetical protein
MVHVIDAVERTNGKGEKFISLILSGGIEFVKSAANKFYATVRKTSIPCTLDLKHAKSMIGSKMPGSIIKRPCEEYEYTTPKGEQIVLNFTYEYSEQSDNMEENVFS